MACTLSQIAVCQANELFTLITLGRWYDQLLDKTFILTMQSNALLAPLPTLLMPRRQRRQWVVASDILQAIGLTPKIFAHSLFTQEPMKNAKIPVDRWRTRKSFIAIVHQAKETDPPGIHTCSAISILSHLSWSFQYIVRTNSIEPASLVLSGYGSRIPAPNSQGEGSPSSTYSWFVSHVV